MAEVRKELPQLKQFATLSPVPDFRRWLEEELHQNQDAILTSEEQEALAEIAKAYSVEPSLQVLLSMPGWESSEQLCDTLKPILTRLCALHLVSRHPSKNKLLNAVAHFHISNGAVLHQINWMADNSKKGISQSYGLMVNYLYSLDDLDENSENYSNTHIANISKEVENIVGADQLTMH